MNHLRILLSAIILIHIAHCKTAPPAVEYADPYSELKKEIPAPSAKLATILDENFQAHQFTSKPLNKAEFLSLVERVYNAFPLGKIEFQGAGTATQFRFSGKHSGNLDLTIDNIGYYQPTGRQVSMNYPAKVTTGSGQVTAIHFAGPSPFTELLINRLGLRKQDWQAVLYVPPGHYYSPIPNTNEIKQNLAKMYAKDPMLGVDLREEEQLEMLKTFLPYYKDLDFPETEQKSHRYYYKNDWYVYAEAITLNFFLRHFKPKTVIEVGSGFSTGVMLDTNEKFLNNGVKINCVEPYPGRLHSLVRKTDNFKLYQKNLQDIDLSMFKALNKNDILFIDSTHVARANSDVNYVLHHIMPNLKKGVLIHFHDIYYQFEYPKSWVLENRAWNESYILRSFLQYNSCFEIVLWNAHVGKRYRSWLNSNMPLFNKLNGGAIWLRKTCN